jgi:archaeosine-15-forming tRNA-guanine transglycosylase
MSTTYFINDKFQLTRTCGSYSKLYPDVRRVQLTLQNSDGFIILTKEEAMVLTSQILRPFFDDVFPYERID